jgi:hypothetical protein
MTPLSSGFDLMSASKCGPTTLVRHATQVWAPPFSLATTRGIIIIFFSCGYLDVSVLRVGSLLLGWYAFSIPGCPIRKSSDGSLVCSSPKLIAAYHVLLRLIDPRHPPCALICFKKVYSVLDPRTISKVQRCRPLACIHRCTQAFIQLLLLLQLYFPNMSKNWFNEQWTVNNEQFTTSLKFVDVKATNPLDLTVYILLSKELFAPWTFKQLFIVHYSLFICFCGGYRSRTDDPLRARQML